jgi:hypothetical protein
VFAMAKARYWFSADECCCRKTKGSVLSSEGHQLHVQVSRHGYTSCSGGLLRICMLHPCLTNDCSTGSSHCPPASASPGDNIRLLQPHDTHAKPAQVRPPMPPTYFFAIDVSAEAVSSGVLQVGSRMIDS